jgi:hypothetical protein
MAEKNIIYQTHRLRLDLIDIISDNNNKVVFSETYDL